MLLSGFKEEIYEKGLREEGREEGRKEGRREGLEEGMKEGRIEGREEGIREGLLGFVAEKIDAGLSDRDIIEKLKKYYNLDESQAAKYLQTYK